MFETLEFNFDVEKNESLVRSFKKILAELTLLFPRNMSFSDYKISYIDAVSFVRGRDRELYLDFINQYNKLNKYKGKSNKEPLHELWVYEKIQSRSDGSYSKYRNDVRYFMDRLNSTYNANYTIAWYHEFEGFMFR